MQHVVHLPALSPNHNHIPTAKPPSHQSRRVRRGYDADLMATLSPASPAGAAHAQAPFQGRLAKLRARMSGKGLPSFLITNPLDVAYLTGFHGGDSYLLLTPDASTLISDFRYEEELEPIKPLATVYIRKGPMSDAVASVFNNSRAGRCGIQADAMTIAERDSISKAIAGGSGADSADILINTTGLVAEMRLIKDAGEIDMIRRAVVIQQDALLATLPYIKPGTTELEIAGRLEAEMKSRGSSQPGFQSIIAAEPNGSFPHYRPGPARVAANRSVLIDWGAIYQGYHSDMTRVFALGTWPAKIREIYKIVLDAQELAAAALAPGKTTREIDAIARDHITRHGYGEQFGHGLGHGLGFNGHEEPRLSHMLAATQLQEGQVVTVEPGIYLPGIGGVRIEDDYVITARGAENLCTMPKNLEWATI